MSSKVINISLPESLLKLIDAIADSESRSRSEFFREAARRYIEDLIERMGGLPPGHRYSIAELRRLVEEERQGSTKLGLKARRAIRNVRRRIKRKKKTS